MGFRLGDKIQLTSAARMRTPEGSSYVPMNKEFQIAGLFHTGRDGCERFAEQGGFNGLGQAARKPGVGQLG